MMAKALDKNGAGKVFIMGRRLDKLQEVAGQAVRIIALHCIVTHKSRQTEQNRRRLGP